MMTLEGTAHQEEIDKLTHELAEARQAMLDGRGLEAELQRQMEERLEREKEKRIEHTQADGAAPHRQARPRARLGGVARPVPGAAAAQAHADRGGRAAAPPKARGVVPALVRDWAQEMQIKKKLSVSRPALAAGEADARARGRAAGGCATSSRGARQAMLEGRAGRRPSCSGRWRSGSSARSRSASSTRRRWRCAASASATSRAAGWRGTTSTGSRRCAQAHAIAGGRQAGEAEARRGAVPAVASRLGDRDDEQGVDVARAAARARGRRSAPCCRSWRR